MSVTSKINENKIASKVINLFTKTTKSIMHHMNGKPTFAVIRDAFKTSCGVIYEGLFSTKYDTNFTIEDKTVAFNPFEITPAIAKVSASVMTLNFPIAAADVTALKLTNGDKVGIDFTDQSDSTKKLILYPRQATYVSTGSKITFNVEVLDLNTVALTTYSNDFAVRIYKF